MRIQGKLRLGYFPLPLTEARRIRACLRYPTSPLSAIDPCIGDGAAFLTITGQSCARRYGIELDAYRAEQAAAVVDDQVLNLGEAGKRAGQFGDCSGESLRLVETGNLDDQC